MSKVEYPIRILFTIPNFITAGSGQALLNIASRLDPQFFSPSIAVLKTGGKLEAEINAMGIQLLELPFTVNARPRHQLPARAWRAASLFRPYGFQVWHSFHYSDDYTEPIIARMSGAHAWIYTKKNMSYGSRAWRIRTWLATRVLAQNTTMLERFFVARRTRAKVKLVPCGVDTRRFHPDALPQLNIRQHLKIDASAFVIGVVAHLVRVKGHPTLLHALARVPAAHLVIAGKPLEQDYVDELHRLASELGLQDRVHFIGNVENVPALHAELDAFVLPTLGRGEGCPVALLEAMACGKPSVATNIPGSRDVIEHGVSGLLVPPEDPDALSEALLSLVRSAELRASLAEGARQRILANYTIEREVAEHEALYLEVMGRI